MENKKSEDFTTKESGAEIEPREGQPSSKIVLLLTLPRNRYKDGGNEVN